MWLGLLCSFRNPRQYLTGRVNLMYNLLLPEWVIQTLFLIKVYNREIVLVYSLTRTHALILQSFITKQTYSGCARPLNNASPLTVETHRVTTEINDCNSACCLSPYRALGKDGSIFWSCIMTLCHTEVFHWGPLKSQGLWEVSAQF